MKNIIIKITVTFTKNNDDPILIMQRIWELDTDQRTYRLVSQYTPITSEITHETIYLSDIP